MCSSVGVLTCLYQMMMLDVAAPLAPASECDHSPYA